MLLLCAQLLLRELQVLGDDMVRRQALVLRYRGLAVLYGLELAVRAASESRNLRDDSDTSSRDRWIAVGLSSPVSVEVRSDPVVECG